MPDEMFEIIKITYSIILPVLVGYFATVIKSNRETKKDLASSFKGINDKIDGFETKIDDVKKLISDEQMRTARYRIIRYDDECKQGVVHSEDHEAQILEDIDTYQKYCNTHPEFVNHKGQNAMKRILKQEENY